MTSLFGLNLESKISVYFLPNEPVPPVMRIDFPLNIYFSFLRLCLFGGSSFWFILHFASLAVATASKKD